MREFDEQRSQTSLFHGALFINDYFYVLEYDNIEEEAVNAKLRPSVQQTIMNLQHILEDTPPLQDSLSIVEKDLLRTDQRDRISSAHLCTKMKKLLPGR